MKIVSFGGFDFAANGYSAFTPSGAGRASWGLVPQVQPRLHAAPLLTGAQISERTIAVHISYKGPLSFEDAWATLYGQLAPLNPEPRTLIAEREDGSGLQMSCEAIIVTPGVADDANSVNVTVYGFLTADPLWTAISPSTDGPVTIDAANASTTIVNSGVMAVAPVIERSAPTSVFTSSMTKRRRVTVTNSGELPIERETMVVPVDYVSGWFYPRMLKDGTYHPVTTMAASSVSSSGTWPDYHAFPATVDAEESETFDLISQVSIGPDLDTYTRFDGNYSAIDLGWEAHSNITSATSTTITIGTANWPVNRWKWASLAIVGGTGAGQARKLNSNTATVLTVSRAFTTTPDAASDIVLYAGGWLFDGGRASSATATSLTDGSQSWPTDVLIGATITTTGGTGSGQTKTITDNTLQTVTVDSAWSVTPDATTTYVIKRPGVHRYYTEYIKHSEAHRGGWQINKRFTRPSKKLWGPDVLNGWEPYTMLDNGDDYNQLAVTEVLLGGSDYDYWPNLNASRWRGADTRKQEEGQGDGVAIHHPWGYSRITYDYQLVNQNSASGATKGIGKFVLMGREAGGDEFEEYFKDDTLIAGPALTDMTHQTLDLQPYGNPVDLYMGVLPVDGVEISREARESDKINAQWGDSLILYVDTYQKFGYSVDAAENVIPIQDEIRIGDYALQIGMRDGQRLFLNAATDTLYLDCANARAWVDDGVNETDVTYAVTPVIYDGTDYRVADRWPVLEPGSNTVTFDGDPWATDGEFEATFTFRERHLG